MLPISLQLGDVLGCFTEWKDRGCIVVSAIYTRSADTRIYRIQISTPLPFKRRANRNNYFSNDSMCEDA
jgi:hypothetical protein